MKNEQAPSSPFGRAISFLGLFVFIGICYAMSDNRSKINWRLVAWGMGLQLLFGVLVLKTGPGLWVFQQLNSGAMALLGFGQQGTNFLFQSFVTGKVDSSLVNFTFNVLPTIIFFSSLMTLGYYLGIMQWVVNIFSVVMQKTMKCSGAETLSTAANIFVGQTEAPLVIKPYVKDMTNSELLAVMVGGFANTAGGVLAARRNATSISGYSRASYSPIGHVGSGRPGLRQDRYAGNRPAEYRWRAREDDQREDRR